MCKKYYENYLLDTIAIGCGTFGLSSYGVSGDADADFDSDTDGADFLAWQRQYSGIRAAIVPLASVPEPTTFSMLFFVFVAGSIIVRWKEESVLR